MDTGNRVPARRRPPATSPALFSMSVDVGRHLSEPRVSVWLPKGRSSRASDPAARTNQRPATRWTRGASRSTAVPFDRAAGVARRVAVAGDFGEGARPPVRGRDVLRVRRRRIHRRRHRWIRSATTHPPCGSPTRRRGCIRRSGNGSSRSWAWVRSGSGRSVGASRRRCSGSSGVALLYLLALRLWRSVWWAGFAALLLALDGLHIVQSRVAMLDILLTTFITAAVLMLVLDRERMESPPRSGRRRRLDRVFGSPYRMLTGVFLGCAVATKWSGAFALPFAAALCTIWLFRGGRRGDRFDRRVAGDAGDELRDRPRGRLPD